MGVSVPGEATTQGQPAPPVRSFADALRSVFAPVAGLLRPLEVHTRMLGLVGALAVIWIAFDVLSGGTFRPPAPVSTIAAQLYVGESAIKQHLGHLFDKFGIDLEEHKGERRIRLANAAIETGAVTRRDLL